MKQNKIFVSISVLTILLTVSFVAEAQRQKIKGRTQSTIDQEESIVSFHLKYFFVKCQWKWYIQQYLPLDLGFNKRISMHGYISDPSSLSNV